MVAAVYDRALTFLLDTRDPLFPDVPIAALVTGKPVSAPDRVSIIREGDAFGDSAALALTLQPKARQIVIIDGVVEERRQRRTAHRGDRADRSARSAAAG